MTSHAGAPASRSTGRFTAGLAVLVAGLYGTFAVWPQLFAWMGIEHIGTWFLDSYAILATLEAVKLGADPHVSNALDLLGRPHVYSHWWLWLGSLGLTRADNLWVGFSWVAAFLVTALCWLRPRGVREVLGALFVFGSAPVLLACDRANNDLVIFVVLSAVVPCLLAANRAVRWLAVGALALATGLKYYPAAAALVMLGEGGRRDLVARVLVTGVALGLVLLSIRHDLAAVAAMVPQPDGFLTFGASLLLRPLVGGGLSGGLVLAALLVAAGVAAWRIASGLGGAASDEHRREYLGFILGSALLTGCFWTSVNYGYRWIFSLWLLPWLWRSLGVARLPGRMRGWVRLTLALLFVALWADAIAMAVLNAIHRVSPLGDIQAVGNVVFFLLQPFSWAFFFCLLVFLLQFFQQALPVVLGRRSSDHPAGLPQ